MSWCTDKSKWCVEFLRKVRAEFDAIKKTEWFKYVVDSVDSRFFGIIDDSPLDRKSWTVLKHEAREGMAEFLANFTHLGFAEGVELGVDGVWQHSGGEVHLVLKLPRGERLPVEMIEHDPYSVESTWEKEVLSWVSSQFHLFWHAGYSARKILIGDASCMEKEIGRSLLKEGFFEQIKTMTEEDQRRYFSMDFSPRVELVDDVPQITYYTFSPFVGIVRRRACEITDDEENVVVPYNCGVHF